MTKIMNNCAEKGFTHVLVLYFILLDGWSTWKPGTIKLFVSGLNMQYSAS